MCDGHARIITSNLVTYILLSERHTTIKIVPVTPNLFQFLFLHLICPSKLGKRKKEDEEVDDVDGNADNAEVT